MMEGLDNVIPCCIILLFLLVTSNYAQDGFVSIQCCGDTAFTDPNTTISYITDESWYSDENSCQNTVWIGNINQETNEARFFESRYDSKWCYSLPTRSESVYLIRGTFPLTNPQDSPSDTFFNVSVAETEIDQVNYVQERRVEGLFRATRNYTNFCLVKGKGQAYISKLELRPSQPEYLQRYNSSVLKLVDRVDVGNRVAEIRFRDDLYDRIWRSDVYPDSTASYVLVNTNISNTVSDSIVPPRRVLQTAVTHPERLEFHYENLDVRTSNFDLYLYFLENDTVHTGERVFDVYINDVKMQPVDIMASGSPYFALALSFNTSGVLNLTLAKSLNSQFGPICNAYELFQVYPRNGETDVEEADAIIKVKKELLVQNQYNEVLKTWSGDPCLPLPWHGLSCQTLDTTSTSVINKMDLSSTKLTGPLPSNITQLNYLKELNLSNNGFISTVPQFPASSILTSLDVSHNDLTGNLTWSISMMQYLDTLYFGCNAHLEGRLPTNIIKSNVTTDNGVCDAKVSSHPARGILIGTIAGGLMLVVVIVGACWFCIYRKKKMIMQKHDDKRIQVSKNAIYSIVSAESVVMKSIAIQCFSLKYIETATQMFKTMIGEGGFGSVYRGTLPDGQEVAVKVRSATSTQGTREFDNELNLLSAIRHENLVPLIGYCCENDQQILVYPFMSNGSLQDRLYGGAKRKTLDWPTRLSIALGAARGLTYLHTFSERCVIHRDVKSSNILLDHSMCAKVADFGFSKYAPQEGDSGTSLEVRGTAGYLDPEYYSTQHLSAKSDVFSFGVVLLEIVSGREPLNINRPKNEWSLVEWAKPHIRNSKVDEIVDPSIKGGYHAEAMWRVVEVALACIEPYSAYRPCMADIVRELEDAFIIENNASEYMKSIESLGGSNRYSIERPIVITPSPIPMEASPILMQPPPPQPR